MDAIPYLDELVKEYLLFRGYTNTFHVFNQERGADPTRLPQVSAAGPVMMCSSTDALTRIL